MINRHVLAACFLLPSIAFSQSASQATSSQAVSFQETVQQTLLSNPEVQNRFHVWQAAREERAAAAGGFYPRVDLSASTLREDRRRPGVDETYNVNQATLTLTQMLFDGFSTRNEVSRLDHAALVRYFELRDISENMTLEVVRAYADLARHRELVRLAEENFAQHRAVFDLIEERVTSGVGRRVDLETSSGRLALAETNLLTEMSNLHDVTARFTRLTGITPSANLDDRPKLADRIPKDAENALAESIQRSPALWAAFQNARAAKSAAGARKAAYMPRLDLQVRSSDGRNLNGVVGSDRANSIGLVLNWNLYSGGSDMARERQFAAQLNAAEDMVEKGCRDLRQTLLIAYNDTQKLATQIEYLDQHQLSTEKARDAYRRQFDIGQRSLLDLLDTENELFQARRSYVNALHDLEVAHARVAASLGGLVESLGLVAQGSDALPDVMSEDDKLALANQCRVAPPMQFVIDQEAIQRRVEVLKRESANNAVRAN